MIPITSWSSIRAGPAVLAIALAGAIAVPSVAAQEAGPPMTVEDVLELRSVGDPEISPDGRWVVHVVTVRDTEEDVNDSDLWIAPTSGAAPYRLTRGPKRDASPEWAPDGSWVAFISSRGDESQVWGIAPDGGEAWQVTDWPTGVNAFRIAPDGRSIAFVANPETTEEAKELEKLRGRPIVWDSAYATGYSRLWVAPLDEARQAVTPEATSPDTLHVTGFVWGPDSRALAWSARPSPSIRDWPDTDIYAQDEVGGPLRRVTSMPGAEGPVDWSRELGLVFSGNGSEDFTDNDRLWRADPAGGDPIALTDELDENAGFVAATGTALWVEAAYRTGRRLYRIPLENGQAAGAPRVVTDDERYYHSFSATREAARFALIAEGPATPPDVHVTDAGTFRPRRLTETNPQVDGFALGAHRIVSWSSAADGEEIEGVLTLPVGYRPGDRVPLLLVIHGGPAGVSVNRFTASRGAYPVQVFAGRGYAVLQPNYRGSTGYGERFRGLNKGHISGTDWIDINSGVDHLIDQGIADPDRLGIMGWSFGGHHTYWGITQTRRFAAASAGAGANDLISMYSQTDIPEFYHTYLGPRPWEDFELYEERSAYRYVDRVTTPTLIQVGERDERVPAEQSIQFYTAMKAIGKAPVKLVVYPGEPHGIRSPRHRRDLMDRNVEWFRRWIPVESAAASR